MSAVGLDAAPVWITAVSRTPVTARSRAQAHLGAGELAAGPVGEVAAGTHPAAVVLGNGAGPGGNVARIAALAAGLGVATPGWTVDAQCGAGLVAVAQAAGHAVATGRACVGGGVESPSTAPERSIDGVSYAQAPMVPAGWDDPGMTAAADALAAARGIGRARQESFAARSHVLALAGGLRLPDDDGPRRLDAAALARFRAVTPGADSATAVTGATAARIADGAAAVLVTPHSAVVRETDGVSTASVRGVDVLRPCRVLSWSLTGVDPALPGLGPVSAVRDALDAAGRTLEGVAVVELVEAYAAQVLAALDDLGLTGASGTSAPGASGPATAHDPWGVDPRVNAAGGALALGHPWGASGAVAVVHAVRRLQAEPPGAVGLAACAVGGGMGAAMVLEVA